MYERKGAVNDKSNAMSFNENIFHECEEFLSFNNFLHSAQAVPWWAREEKSDIETHKNLPLKNAVSRSACT